MKQEQQIQLLEELLKLNQQEEFFLDQSASTSPVDNYTDSERFTWEQSRIFQQQPNIVAHVSELPEANSYLRRQINGLPLLILRGDDGETRIFLNVCRHRGTRLVDDANGCRKRFSCPYHAWTWNSRGEFVSAPHFDEGFPNLDKAKLGLKALPCLQRHGFIWLLPPDSSLDLSQFLGELDQELSTLHLDTHQLHHSEEQQRTCNWKLITEGGLESYHFRVAHRNTIAKLFHDNLSSYQCFGPHMRSVLPRASMSELEMQAPERWNIREHANVLYTLFPTSMLLVQADHVIWISIDPLAADSTAIRITTLKPKDNPHSHDYWDKNHSFTLTTLNEDFDLAESMQSGMASGANEALNFGRFEGALAQFNATVDKYLA